MYLDSNVSESEMHLITSKYQSKGQLTVQMLDKNGSTDQKLDAIKVLC